MNIRLGDTVEIVEVASGAVASVSELASDATGNDRKAKSASAPSGRAANLFWLECSIVTS